MATIKLIRSIPGGAADLTVDLMDGPLKCMEEAWTVELGEDGTVVETMTLMANTGTADAPYTAGSARQEVNNITELALQCERFRERPSEDFSVWFQLTGLFEQPRSSLVKSISIVPLAEGSGSQLYLEGYGFWQLVIEHAAWWESGTKNLFQGTQNLSVIGGYYNFSGSPGLVGNLPGRVKQLKIAFNTGVLWNVWCGIRPPNQGVTSFRPKWELELGIKGANTTDMSNASYSPGGAGVTALQVNPGSSDLTLAERVRIRVSHVSPDTNYKHFVGRYLVLLRCGASGASTFRVQMASGHTVSAAGGQLAPADEVYYVHGVGPRMLPLGVVDIPSFPYRGDMQANTACKNFTITISVARTAAGTQIFHMDCLVLIPMEHFVSRVMDDSFVDTFVDAAGEYLLIRTTEDGITTATNHSSADEVQFVSNPSPDNWVVDERGGVFVFAADGYPYSNVGDLAAVTVDYRSRWGAFNEE